MLREEVLAMELRFDRHKCVGDQVRAVGYLIPKNYLRHRLGRSPDRAAAFVMSLWPVELVDDGPTVF